MQTMSQDEQMQLMQTIPAILNMLLLDEVHEQYEVEEEDLVKYITDRRNTENKDLQAAMYDLQTTLYSIMTGGQF